MATQIGSTTRKDGRNSNTLRPVQMDVGFQRNPEGSLLYRCGGTTLLISASVTEGVPDFLRGTGRGWVTAEYSMHPRANPERKGREGRNGRVDGRSQEIQRLVGRALRAAVRLEKLGERTITVDCDVLDADGGTRTAAITGGFVALTVAMDSLRRRGLIQSGSIVAPIAAVSVGLVGGSAMVDLCYTEDHSAQMDFNVVATGASEIVEVQGTAEDGPIPRTVFDQLLGLALEAIPNLVEVQLLLFQRIGLELDRLRLI